MYWNVYNIPTLYTMQCNVYNLLIVYNLLSDNSELKDCLDVLRLNYMLAWYLHDGSTKRTYVRYFFNKTNVCSL